VSNEVSALAPVIPLFGVRRQLNEPFTAAAVGDGGVPGAAIPLRPAQLPFARLVQLDGGAGQDAGQAGAGPVKDIRSVSQLALGRRGLSVSELQGKLTSLGYDEEAVHAELARLQDLDYLNDRRLAEDIVRIESERKGKGRSAVQSELRRRCIAQDDYLEALETLERGSERGRAQELAEKRMRSLSGLDDATVKRRLHSYLARRGFGGDEVSAAVSASMHPRR
jgi:SOS response regulatory protein OraA/RecX